MTTAERMVGSANPRYEDALAFAARAHAAAHQSRKGTSFPYVSHPVRVAEILDRFGYGEDVVVAGFLHDATEDAAVEPAEIERLFGARVAELVAGASEADKALPWQERKEATLAKLEREEDVDVRALVAADKLDNVRSIADTLRQHGEQQTWALFNAGKREQHWYHRVVAATLLRREPNSRLFRTLDFETQSLFPDEGRTTRFFAGKPFRTPHDARTYLADPIKHWKPDHSALELATSWIGSRKIPDSVRRVLETCETYAGCELIEGFFEREVELGTAGRASQTDLLVLARITSGLAVIAVEGKARETFGKIVRDWNTTAGTQARLEDLCGRLGIDPAQAIDLRYQLFHRTVSALIEAQRYGATEALMLVHSFDADDASLDDFRAFAAALGATGAEVGTVTEPIVRDSMNLRLGWVKER